MKHFSIPAALLLGSSIGVVQAQINPLTLQVTATRTAQTADQALASVTIIDREEIERHPTQSLAELLEQTPGIVVSNSGGRGKLTSVFLRGTRSNQLLVLVDGIKVGSATDGAVPFQQISLDLIERIEIVRGPRSSLYGSEAIGGVIQIFTRTGEGEFTPRLSLGVGSEGTREVTLGLSNRSDRGWFNLGLSDYATDGFDATVSDLSSNEPDRDGYENRSYSLGGGYRFNNKVNAELRYTQSLGDNDYDAYFFGPMSNSTDKHRVRTLSTKVTMDPMDAWQLSVSAGKSWDDFSAYNSGAFQYDYETVRNNASVQSHHLLDSHNQFTWGVDFTEDTIDSSSPYNLTQRDNRGVFGLYQLLFGRQDLALSLRQDDTDGFDAETTGSVAWGMNLSSDLRVTASYGTAFKVPTFLDLYYPWGSNPNLAPERSRTIELGVSRETADLRWSASVYQTDIENLILLDSAWIPYNLEQDARIRGLELTAATQLNHWDLSATLDLLDPKDRSTDSLLPRRSQSLLNLSADRDFGNYALGASLRDVGRAKESGGQSINDYTTLDLRAQYSLTPDWTVKATVDNLFDEDYQTAYGYNQPGRTWWLSLHYTP